MALTSDLQNTATQVRRDILRMVHQNASGHPGGSLGCADLMTALYFEVLDHDSKNFTMEGKNQDLFFLSNGHISPVWYSVLARSGYFPVSELKTFRSINSRLQGHPCVEKKLPGIRIASGSLGQGLSVACGAALAKKMNGDNKLVYCLTGDGELQEGQIWEAAMFAAHLKIDNVIAIVDYNRKQIDGPTDKVMSLGDLHAKWRSFGWEVHDMNGNDMQSVIDVLTTVKKNTFKQKPNVILMKTEMGFGVDFMMGTHKWHGSAPDDNQLANALGQLKETIGDY
ncbi:MAG: transketolase [Bacteroidetes bacterium GWF2_38_335]|nr:MAG: transketolase [Bacteroidetes bacterium GWF2_38_335]OFY80132.1 MAG: transketolase [Bacteroidetes bacterium RIFOXYA12_FULL_38_20]HBS88541.1 transketolase [Bacteroidales bacterium]